MTLQCRYQKHGYKTMFLRALPAYLRFRGGDTETIDYKTIQLLPDTDGVPLCAAPILIYTSLKQPLTFWGEDMSFAAIINYTTLKP